MGKAMKHACKFFSVYFSFVPSSRTSVQRLFSAVNILAWEARTSMNRCALFLQKDFGSVEQISKAERDTFNLGCCGPINRSTCWLQHKLTNLTSALNASLTHCYGDTDESSSFFSQWVIECCGGNWEGWMNNLCTDYCGLTTLPLWKYNALLWPILTVPHI